jgi:hypothetical protein
MYKIIYKLNTYILFIAKKSLKMQKDKHLGEKNNGSTNNGSTNNGSTNNGSTNNGSTNNGSTNNGSTNNGSTNNGSTNNGSTNNGSTNNGSNDYVRKSYKFLIKLDDLNKVKEVLDFNCTKFIFDEAVPTTQKISSVYYDNNDYSSYYTRLIKNPDSICIRFRTYNSNEEQIYAECKTHKGYVAERSIKERIRLDKNSLDTFLNSRVLYSQNTPVVFDKINYYITSRNYTPKVKITYNRTSYNDKLIRITLDDDLISIKTNNSKSITEDILLNDSIEVNIFRLQYSVLELKITDGESYLNIDYIDKLIKSNLIMEVPEFSKYLSTLYYFYANELTTKPYWYDDHITNINESNIFENITSKPINTKELNKSSNKSIYPIVLKPNIFTSIESLYYKIFNLIINIPFTLFQYDKITGHTSYLLKPIILKYYIIICLILNLFSHYKINNQLISRTLDRMGTIFPILLTLILSLSILL